MIHSDACTNDPSRGTITSQCVADAEAATASARVAAVDDLKRAKTKVPRPEFRGTNFAEMGEVLTQHLRRSFDRVEDCSNFTVPVLRNLQERLFALAEPSLTAVYQETTDNRRERHGSLEELRAHWDRLVESAPAEVHHVLRDGLCHEVVMRFVHHTTESARATLASDGSFVLPTLPLLKHEHDGRAETAAAHGEYSQLAGCQVCHTRLAPLPEPSQRCLGTTDCPIWPAQFSAPFTLHSTVPYINGAKSAFYYKYTEEAQVQTVDYTEKCFPFVNAASFFVDKPCKLFFNPQGIYLSQPGRVDCCLFKAGVGAVPLEFLQSYTLAGQDVDAPDMYGNTVKCDEWHGPDGFKYWTVGHNDALYKNFGHDIVFQDGPTGVTWRWGNFQVGPQDDALFQLPEGDCSQSCSSLLSADELAGLHGDAHVKRAAQHYGQSRQATQVPTDLVV